MLDIRLCKTKGGIAVRPATAIKMDFIKLKSKYKIVASTPQVIILRDEDEIIVHKYGELIFKNMKNKPIIKKIAEKIYDIAC